MFCFILGFCWAVRVIIVSRVNYKSWSLLSSCLLRDILDVWSISALCYFMFQYANWTIVASLSFCKSVLSLCLTLPLIRLLCYVLNLNQKHCLSMHGNFGLVFMIKVSNLQAYQFWDSNKLRRLFLLLQERRNCCGCDKNECNSLNTWTRTLSWKICSEKMQELWRQ